MFFAPFTSRLTTLTLHARLTMELQHGSLDLAVASRWHHGSVWNAIGLVAVAERLRRVSHPGVPPTQPFVLNSSKGFVTFRSPLGRIYRVRFSF